MKPYESYMDTPESHWYSKLPISWKSQKLRTLFGERRTIVSDKDYPALSVGGAGIVPQLKTAVKTNNGNNRKLICAGDFAINSRSDRKGACGISEYTGSCSLIITVLRPHSELNNHFFHYLLRSHFFSEEFYRNGFGIVSDLWTTRWKNMRNIPAPVPPREEQEQIVRFLDWKVSAIDKLIATKEKQLSILKELLQAKIEKQLHAYPISNTLRLKQLGTFSKGGGFSRDNLVETETYPAILYGDIYTQYEYKTSVIPHHIDGIAYSASRKISKGDIVMAGTGETKDDIGKSILYMGNQSVAVGGDVIIFHPNAKNNAEYLLYQLYSQAALKHRYISSKGDIIVHIYPTAIGNILITLPCVHDQKKAVKRINANIHRVNKTLHLLNEQISNLNELKTRLISDAVTGKIDVRSIKLPNFAKEE